MRQSKPRSLRADAGARAGLQRPVQPDEALAEVVGSDAQPRTELTRRVWSYIKSHDLQDPDDRRVIRADAALKRVFGDKSRISMFELTRLVNQHVH